MIRPMLVLFDVDGTLLLSSGAGLQSMAEAGKRLIGPDFSIAEVEFAGRLDPLIWADAAARNGVADPDAMHAPFREMYGQILADRFARANTVQALPGVPELLDRLAGIQGVTLGLVTGNYPETGTMKLVAAGIEPQLFDVAAWGTDGRIRRDLPAAALRQYRTRLGRPIEPGRVIVVGDTPHDIDCAHACGCRAVAVATGPAFARAELAAHHPDLLLDDLSATDDVVAWMMAAMDSIAQ